VCIRAKKAVGNFMEEFRINVWGTCDKTPQEIHAGVLAIAAKYPTPKLFWPCGDCPACLKAMAQNEKQRQITARKAEQKAVDERFPDLSEYNRTLEHQKSEQHRLMGQLRGIALEPIRLTTGELWEHYRSRLKDKKDQPGYKYKVRFSAACQNSPRSCPDCKPAHFPPETLRFLGNMCGVSYEVEWTPQGLGVITLYPDNDEGHRLFKAFENYV